MSGCVTPLFVPANRLDLLPKAVASGADAIIVDCEDSIPPVGKEKARLALRNVELAGCPVIVRINGIETPWFGEDVEAVERLEVTGVLLPKAEPSQDLYDLRTRLPERIRLLLLIETARGIASARKLGDAPGVCRLAFGSVDYAADLGCDHEAEALAAARAEIVLASRLAGLAAPLDGVTLAIKDPVEVTRDAERARRLGFGGKLCVHPAQIEPVRAAFAPRPAEVAQAERILAADKAGATAVAGIMVDEPVRRRARAILTANQARQRLT
ncbi:HpcH/HpaI aldolase/citrate lyase family protein [Lichenicoccus sp.]|uniref:HpcH/HpaI aldolase/citrate lyase family protein n=1 Tax=Lichenicoccus sp. TaxID=2781899 RepID=UPI003D137C5D